MERIARFSKVSLDQFRIDMNAMGFIDDDAIEKAYESIKLPTRATSGSAGYDFYLPYDVVIGERWQVIPTGIRCEIDPGWMLSIYPKSGLGFKYRTRLANTIGIVDSDYAHADNEGHIMVKINSEDFCALTQGSKFVQGIFTPFGITVDDECDGVRTGGFGSTGDK